MKENTKKYVQVASTLGIIGGVAALLIGLTNFLTVDTIKKNEQKKVETGLSSVYKEATKFEEGDKPFEGTQYLVSYWKAYKDETELGYVYKTSGKNSYGTVSMLIGVYGAGSLGTISLLTNTETYAGTLEDNYVTPYNSGDTKDTAIDDVHCGATYGAKLIQAMAKEAKANYIEDKGL